MTMTAIDLDALNKLRQRAGLEPLDELPPPTIGRWYCSRCDAPMPQNVWACGPCREAYAAEVRDERRADALASIPEVFRACRFGAPRVVRYVARAAVEAARSSSGSVLLAGKAGAGKSTLAAALLLRAIESADDRAPSCRWAGADDVVRAHAEHPLGRGTSPVLDALARAWLVVVDDLGAEHGTAGNPAIDALLHERFRQARPTIVTTGLTADAIERRYGSGILRRLTDRATVISLVAPPRAPDGGLF